MGYRITVQPSPPCTIELLRKHARVTAIDGSHPDDELLLLYAEIAREWAAEYMSMSIGQQTIEYAMDGFPAGAVRLPRAPVVSVTSVAYTDTTGVDQVLDDTLYVLDVYDPHRWLLPAADTEWPETADVANAVRIVYVAGDDVLRPMVIGAILLVVAHLYEHREETTEVALANIPNGARSMLDMIRSHTWGQ